MTPLLTLRPTFDNGVTCESNGRPGQTRATGRIRDRQILNKGEVPRPISPRGLACKCKVFKLLGTWIGFIYDAALRHFGSSLLSEGGDYYDSTSLNS